MQNMIYLFHSEIQPAHDDDDAYDDDDDNYDDYDGNYDDDDDDAMQGEDGGDWNLVPKCAFFYPMAIVQFHPIPVPDTACQKTKLGHFSTSSMQTG